MAEEQREVMDTPERSNNNHIATSISKFEDSPVFNFLNSLSPIKPVKSMPISQTINPLSFSSFPSVFTSPNINSLRESRFLRRHQLSDPSKPEFSSDNGSMADKGKVNVEATKKLDDPRTSDEEMASEPSYECSKIVTEFAENFNFDYNSPNSNIRPKDCLEGKHMTDYESSSLALVPFVEDASRRSLYMNPHGVSQIDRSKEGSSCDWESLISDAPDMLNYESPNVSESYKKLVDYGTSFNTCMKNDMQNTQPREGSGMMENAVTDDIIDDPSLYNPKGWCLVFDIAGARRKHLDGNTSSDVNTSSNDQNLVPSRTGNDSSRCVLPSIGLHLNAIAATPKDFKIVNNEALAFGRLLIGPSSSVNSHPPTQEMLNNTLAVASSERDIDSIENGVLPVEDALPISGFMANEETNQISPKKKRRRFDQAMEGESCKRCNCKKSKCLKLYCECFAAGVYCVDSCSCIECFNKPAHEDTVLATRRQIESRNPLAFAPKVIRGSDSISETWVESSKTPASARHKRGCNCKKSGCLKKYCECYQGGVGCSINCRCEGCKNAFGRKDGIEVELEEDETNTTEKSILDNSLQSDLEQNMDSVPPATPSRTIREFSSMKKPPRSSYPSIGSSSGFNTSNQVYGKPSFFQPPPKFDNHFENFREDEIPEFLQESSSPGINSSSPNRKRVSPPGGLKSSRKLILQSIPSFPSLASNQ
ncbi:hypothetical protein ACJIZ3_013849 [Penstemon smallii]|uniref:CRC domain-containing protein n=1 Tax=Penstemon smallii TaxID=265156 RepID=A0ABD3RLC4_9LAMI